MGEGGSEPEDVGAAAEGGERALAARACQRDDALASVIFGERSAHSATVQRRLEASS